MLVNGNTSMEHTVISEVTIGNGDARITVRKVPDQPGVAAKVFGPIAQAGIDVDMIVQDTRAGGQTDITFTVTRKDFEKAMEIQTSVAEKTGALEVKGDEHIAKVSIHGVGMKNHSWVATRMFSTLAEENINMMMISTSESCISCVMSEANGQQAVDALKKEFEINT